MKLGDLAFFYASQGKNPGITGIVEVVKEHEPDFTVTDASSIGFVEPKDRGKENKWSLVHVEFRKKLSPPVLLKDLQKYYSDRGVLKDMQLLKQARLSVSKVSEKEWNFIVDNLIEGYEGDGDEDAFDDVDQSTPMPNIDGGDQASGGEDDDAAINANLDEPEEAFEGDEVDEPKIELPHEPMDVDVDEFPTSGTEIPPITHATSTSRPTSRQEVRNESRPESRAANSRQGSIAPLPVFQTTEEISTSIAITQAVAEPARPGSRGSRAGSLKPVSRASSRAPSRAGSLQPAGRFSSLEPSARPTSRGRDKTPNPALMTSLMESTLDS
jgi:predicted RNA-binding protein with PUA-like domain